MAAGLGWLYTRVSLTELADSGGMKGIEMAQWLFGADS
ncbi:MAG: hypothetical protein ETSY1_34255 [Candidatus Entotheonella factor]|uniref:Uncharacterized protein n=1 Tax=Entotheonella factor TaxID=1429438 RepID=W4L9K0_ENTF1|nr:MAG: hypothetical protein ETSY1_34255 [Candidatus Entotheonella factor]